jgi:hypothetical protein
MNPIIGLVAQVGTILFGFGFAYGMLKDKVRHFESSINKLGKYVERLDLGNRQSVISEERQSVINANVAEKLDLLKDQLDIYSLAIKQLENDVIRIKMKCRVEEPSNG